MKTKFLAAALLFSLSLQAQPHLSRNHYMGTGLPTPPSTSPTAYPYDLKNFSVTPYVADPSGGGGTADLYLSTATAFQDGVPMGIFFYPFLSNGASVACTPLGGGVFTQTRFLYNDINYSHERAVAIVSLYNAATHPGVSAVILGQVRDGSGRHGIKLLSINYCTGSIVKDITCFSPFAGYGIHPLDMVYHAASDKFFICGYLQDEATGLNREAFVAEYDEVTGSVGLGHCMNWNSGVAGPYDYDMAIRIKLLKNSSNAGKLLILGSNNIATTYGNNSASMAVIMDPFAGVLYQTSITDWTLQPSDFKDEYAYDAVEQPNGFFFIYSNKFTPDATAEPSYYPNSRYTMITRSDLHLGIPGTTARAKMQISGPGNYGSWGNCVISNNVIAGFQATVNGSCQLSGHIPPSVTNITPFLSKAVPTWNPLTGITVAINFWKLYHTQSPPSNFYTLGGIQSNVSWPTKFATDNATTTPPTTDLMAVVPVMNNVLPAGTPANKLAYKFIRTDNLGNMDNYPVYSCDNIYSDCPPDVTYVMAKGLATSTFRYSGQPTNDAAGSTNQITPIWVNDSLGCDLWHYFRSTAVNELSETDAVKIYPNPTYDLVNVEFNSTSNEVAKIYVYNVSGQKVLEHSVKTSIGINKIPVSILSLANGNYLLELRNGAATTRQLITKQ